MGSAVTEADDLFSVIYSLECDGQVELHKLQNSSLLVAETRRVFYSKRPITTNEHHCQMLTVLGMRLSRRLRQVQS